MNLCLSFRTLSLVSIAIMCTLSALIICKKPQLSLPVAAATQDTDVQSFLHKQEIEAWAQLKKIGIDKQAVLQKAKLLEKNTTKRHIDKKLHASTCNLIDTVLTQSGINPHIISLYHRDESYSAAAAGNNCIYITQDIFNGLSKEAKKFVIAHEAQHILNKDMYVLQATEELSKAFQLNTASPACPLNYLSRFFEFRADINAALLGTEFAQGYKERAQSWVTHNLDLGTCHPKHAERLALAEKILTNLPKSTQLNEADHATV